MTSIRKLLVVDNEVDICNFVKSFFEARGIQVITALHADEGLALLEQEKPDIVLLDIGMRTDTEGLEFLPRFKQALPSVKVFVVTGVNDEETIAHAKILGADDYITKPLVLEYLEGTVLKKIDVLNNA